MSDKQRRIDEEPIIAEALKERHAEDIWLLDCPWCGVPSYWNQGSHFTCRICDRTVIVTDDDSASNTSAAAESAITLADYWESAPYPCDESRP